MSSAIRAYLLRFLALLVVVTLINFLLPRLLPGSPLRPGGGEIVAAYLPKAAGEALARTYYLDRPLGEQFALYLRGLLRGDLGWSVASHRPVAALIAERLPWTLFLVGTAVLVSGLIGGGLGTASAWWPRRRWARFSMPVVIGLGALPEFLVAMMLIIAFSVAVQAFPASGAFTPFASAGNNLQGLVGFIGDVLWHATLPALTLIAGLVPAFFLLTRNALVIVLGEAYLLTARGKGLPEGRVMWHAWRNALPPVVTLLGLRLAFAVTGAAVTERIFSYPGIGLLLFEAVRGRDYPVMQGVFLVASLAILSMNFLLDLATVMLDPRARRPRSA